MTTTSKKREYSTTCTFKLACVNGLLEDYPATQQYTVVFDATDLTIHGWVQEFAKMLRMAGFAEKSITEYLGDV